MLKVRHEPTAPTRTLRLASGDKIDAHRHDDHQIVYAGRGVLAVTTDQGSWVAPATRAIWIPAGTFHAHRAYGELKLHTVGLSASDNPLQLDSPTVLAVGPLLRELIIAYTGSDADTPERARLRAVLLDQLLHLSATAVTRPDSHRCAASRGLRHPARRPRRQPDPRRTRPRSRRQRSQSVSPLSSRPRYDFPAVAHSVTSASRARSVGRTNTGHDRGTPMRLVIGECLHRGVSAQLRAHPRRVGSLGHSRIRFGVKLTARRLTGFACAPTQSDARHVRANVGEPRQAQAGLQLVWSDRVVGIADMDEPERQ